MATDPPLKSSPDLPRAQRIPPATRGSSNDAADLAVAVPVSMTRNDIADYLGLTAETVSRTLGRMKRAGDIAITDAHHITIVRPVALRDIAKGF